MMWYTAKRDERGRVSVVEGGDIPFEQAWQAAKVLAGWPAARVSLATLQAGG